MHRLKEFWEKEVPLPKEYNQEENKIYTALFSSKTQEEMRNLFFISDRIVKKESKNTKEILEDLWSLKKSRTGEEAGTIDLLIDFYQKKLDLLRDKEEVLVKTTGDSQKMIEDRKKKNSELARVRQDLDDCRKTAQQLKEKEDRLSKMESELKFIDDQIKKELTNNENLVIGTLVEIFLTNRSITESGLPERIKNTTETVQRPPARPGTESPASSIEERIRPRHQLETDEIKLPDDLSGLSPHKDSEEVIAGEGDVEAAEIKSARDLYEKHSKIKRINYYKSVTKTHTGKKLSEFYFNPSDNREPKRMIFNGRYFIQQLNLGVIQLLKEYDQALYDEIFKMIARTYRKIYEGSDHITFEFPTQELFNMTTLETIKNEFINSEFDQIIKFCADYNELVESIGPKYNDLLIQQIEGLRPEEPKP